MLLKSDLIWENKPLITDSELSAASKLSYPELLSGSAYDSGRETCRKPLPPDQYVVNTRTPTPIIHHNKPPNTHTQLGLFNPP